MVSLAICDTTTKQTKSIKRKVWLFKKADFKEANHILQIVPVDSLPASDVDNLWTQWRDFFMITMQHSIPTKIIRQGQNLPYLTKALTRSIKHKLKLFKTAREANTKKAWSRYTTIRNKVTSSLRQAKARFFDDLSKKINSPKGFWSAYHKLSPSKHRIPGDLTSDETSATTTTEKADLLNRTFAKCFTSPTTFDPPSPSQEVQESPTLESISCSESVVHDLLSTCKPNTATGPDGVTSRMLRETAPTIAPQLTKIFNQSLHQSIIPSSWKLSNVTPIPKGGNEASPLNYRPVSLLSLVSKILERIVHSRLSSFIYSNNLMTNCQFGFRPKSSTQEALISVTHSWHQLLSKHRQVAAVFFDVRKAFDSVPHNRILSSIWKMGIRGSLFLWLKDYLTDRRQRVVLDGVTSQEAQVTSGVPQGSILGPLLFNIFMNSIAKLPLTENTKLILYADDIVLYKPIDSAVDNSNLQADINHILLWMKTNGLTPNVAKTNLLVLSRSRTQVQVNVNTDGHHIPPSDTVKYLGVVLRSDLKWSSHIEETSKKAKQHLGLIHRTLHQAPPRVRCQIYRSVTIPRLDYCGAVWDPHLSKDIQALENVHKFAARVITHQWKDSYPDLLKQLQ